MRTRISLARRSFSVGGCSMKITEDVRRFAAEQEIAETDALEVGLKEKADEFTARGAELYTRR